MSLVHHITILRKDSNKNPSIILLFFLSPIIAFLQCLKNIQNKYAILVISLFGSYFGFMMDSSNEEYDISHYLNILKQSPTLSECLNNIISGIETDIYAPLSISIIGSFTQNGHILMLWFGMVFGIVFAFSLRRFNNSDNIYNYLYIFSFAGILGFATLAGVRYVTAFHVYFIGVTGYLKYKELKYIVIILSSIAIHFSLIPAVLIFMVYLLLKRYHILIICLSIISFIFTFVDIESLISTVSVYFGYGIQSRVTVYSTEYVEMLESLNGEVQEAVWFIRYKSTIAFTSAIIILAYLFILYKRINRSSFTDDLLYYILLYLSFRNIVANVPDLGTRYTTMFIMFSIFLSYKLYNDNKLKFKNKILIQIFPIITILGCFLYTAYGYRCIFLYIPFQALLLSPFIGLTKASLDPDRAIRQL